MTAIAFIAAIFVTAHMVYWPLHLLSRKDEKEPHHDDRA